MQSAVALTIIALAMYLLVRKVDVRLVLFGAGLALASLVLRPLVVFEVFLAEMGNGRTIGPICSAMGYAFVLRATGCDRAMVRLLLGPASRARWLLIPAGCAVGFVTNIAVTSQTATAAAVGPARRAAAFAYSAQARGGSRLSSSDQNCQHPEGVRRAQSAGTAYESEQD